MFLSKNLNGQNVFHQLFTFSQYVIKFVSRINICNMSRILYCYLWSQSSTKWMAIKVHKSIQSKRIDEPKLLELSVIRLSIVLFQVDSFHCASLLWKDGHIKVGFIFSWNFKKKKRKIGKSTSSYPSTFYHKFSPIEDLWTLE